MKLIKFFTLFFIYNLSPAQESKTDEYIGVLQLPDTSIITFKLSFRADGHGKITGSTITDFYGENATRSKITGTINKKEKRISFDETENISTRSGAKESEFCYIHVKNARILSVAKKTIIQGTFTGKFENNTPCTNGKFYVVGSDFIDLLDNELKVRNKSSQNDSGIAASPGIKKWLSDNDAIKLGQDESFKIKWHSDEIILELWDAIKADNDKVSIYMNDNRILENFTIGKEKKVLVIPFKEKACTIKIQAVSEGDISPNTMNMSLKDSSAVTPLLSNLKKNETCFLKFEKNQNEK